MELAKQAQYFESDEGDVLAESTLHAIVQKAASTLEAFPSSKEVSPDEASDSSSEEPEEEIIEDFKEMEETHDDEDFIALGQSPKGKRKGEKRPKSVKSSSRKRKCEFCGTVETPMWRRGPTGKGTLCNACGVKWSLKFRKRAGKKPKANKELEPREQRQSARKKLPAKKVSENDPTDVALCCAHTISKKRSLDFEEPDDHCLKRKRESSDEEDLSDDNNAESHRLLGRLLNVVEYQLVEERNIDIVRKQVNELRGELYSKEKTRQRELEQQKSYTLSELLDFKREVLNMVTPHGVSQATLVDASAQVMNEFSSNIKTQMDELRAALGTMASNGLGKKLDTLQTELLKLQTCMTSHFAALQTKVSTGAVDLEKILNGKELSIKNSWTMLKKSNDEEFLEMNQRLDKMEEAL